MKVDHEFITRILSCPNVTLSSRTKSPRGVSTSVVGQQPVTTPRISTASNVGNSPTPRTKKPYQATGPLLISNATERKELSFFNLLYTDMGFKNCQKIFCDESISTHCRLTESQFINFMRELTDLGDHQIVEIFDIFDIEDTGSVGFKSFFLLFSLITAIESGQGKQYLYLHGEAIYELIARNSTETSITWQTFTKFAFLIGIDERQLFSSLSIFNINIFEKISFQDFMLYYFFIMDEIDKGRKTQPDSWHNQLRAGGVEDGDKNKQCSIQ